MRKALHAEIAGAGFAGLAASIALRQRGWTVRVHEMNPELRAFGAGIYIWENGLRVLHALGAYEDVMSGAFEAPAFETRTDGERLAYREVNGEQRFRVTTMTRQNLYQAMLKAAREAGVEIVTHSCVSGATRDGTLQLADGRILAADLVIGADGVRSNVRDSLGIAVDRRQYRDGIIRVLTGRGALKGGDWDNVIDFWHTRERVMRILYTPCGPDTLYLAMMAPAQDGDAAAIPVRPAPWVSAFPELAPALTSLGDRGRYDMYETTHINEWVHGRVAIVGDAAHAMPPTLGQGAGCAMMNALSLAVVLSEYDDVETGLREWEKRERHVTDHTQRVASELAATRSLASGKMWDDEHVRTALHIPTGTGTLSLPRSRSHAS